MAHLELLEKDQYPIGRGIGVCKNPILFNSQHITLEKLLNNDFFFQLAALS